jgi:DNA-binding Lrp family transcriptional regulator
MKLDKYDKKILFYLDVNSREKLTNIAKSVRLSKQTTLNRIKRLEKEEIIIKPIVALNFNRLGYNPIKLYFKLQNIDDEIIIKIIEFWKSKSSVWIASCYGVYDFAVTLLIEDMLKLEQDYFEFINVFEKNILNKELLILYNTSMLTRKYLLEDNIPKKEIIHTTDNKKYKLDLIEHKIIKELANNSRISTLEITKKTKLTRDIINYRIKKLEKENIIQQYKLCLNMNKMNFILYKILLKTKNINKMSKKLRLYALNNRNTIQYLKLIGSWDFELELEVDSEKSLQDILFDIRKQFSEDLVDYGILRFTQTHKFDYYCFNK